MTPDKVIEWAREVGFVVGYGSTVLEKLTSFAELATEAERKLRQAAQIENEALKARIARFGMEQAIAVNKARKDKQEQCAKVARDLADKCEAEAQRCLENGEADEVSAIRSTAWKLTVCEDAIRALKD